MAGKQTLRSTIVPGPFTWHAYGRLHSGHDCNFTTDSAKVEFCDFGCFLSTAKYQARPKTTFIYCISKQKYRELAGLIMTPENEWGITPLAISPRVTSEDLCVKQRVKQKVHPRWHGPTSTKNTLKFQL
jgi:hypothetical protein